MDMRESVSKEPTLKCDCGEELALVPTYREWEHGEHTFKIINVPSLRCLSCESEQELTQAGDSIKVALLMEIMQEEGIFEVDYVKTAAHIICNISDTNDN